MKTVYIIIGIVAFVGIIVVFGRGAGSSGGVSMPEGTTDEDIRELAQQGKKIQAIKWYRELHGVGLAEAKQAVEEMI